MPIAYCPGRARSLLLQSPVPAATEQPLEPPQRSIKVMLRTLADSLVAEVEVAIATATATAVVMANRQ